MKKILERYLSVHRVSPFCELGGFRDILHYYGHELSVPMIFGISGAMSFAYGPGHLARPLAPDYHLPVYIVTPFNPFPLLHAYRVTNVWTYSGRSINRDELWEVLKQRIDEGRPVMVEVEISSYFRLIGVPMPIMDSLSIGGHVVTVIGYDEERQKLTLVETMLKNGIEVDKEKFLETCSVFDSYIPPENEWTVHFVAKKLPPMKGMIKQGIKRMVHQMVHPYEFSTHHHFGLKGLKKFVSTFQNWPSLMDAGLLKKSLVLFNNFVQQYRNSGFLRSLYADFLLEAEAYFGDKRLQTGAELYLDCQKKWNQVLNLLPLSLKDQTKGVFADENQEFLGQALAEILTAEEKALDYLGNLMNNW